MSKEGVPASGSFEMEHRSANTRLAGLGDGTHFCEPRSECCGLRRRQKAPPPIRVLGLSRPIAETHAQVKKRRTRSELSASRITTRVGDRTLNRYVLQTADPLHHDIIHPPFLTCQLRVLILTSSNHVWWKAPWSQRGPQAAQQPSRPAMV